MASWIVGDIHGCSEELAELLRTLALGPGDRLISVGDLFHRGPDPAGVMDLLREARATWILGNHEHRVLQRFGLAPMRSDGRDRPTPGPLPRSAGELAPADLAGDGGTPCLVPAERCADLLAFLQSHAGFFIEGSALDGTGPTADGRDWCVVHAGLVPGRAPSDCAPFELTRLRRLEGRGRPFWYEVYAGPTLALFGHTQSEIPRISEHRGRPVAIGLDTGCVYGGSLTAYSPELAEFVQVPAKRAWAAETKARG